jgi:hypothetical protein
MTRDEMKASFDVMMARVNGPYGALAERILTRAFWRLAGCEPCDSEEAAAYLAYDKELTYRDCCDMCS